MPPAFRHAAQSIHSHKHSKHTSHPASSRATARSDDTTAAVTSLPLSSDLECVFCPFFISPDTSLSRPSPSCPLPPFPLFFQGKSPRGRRALRSRLLVRPASSSPPPKPRAETIVLCARISIAHDLRFTHAPSLRNHSFLFLIQPSALFGIHHHCSWSQRRATTALARSNGCIFRAPSPPNYFLRACESSKHADAQWNAFSPLFPTHFPLFFHSTATVPIELGAPSLRHNCAIPCYGEQSSPRLGVIDSLDDYSGALSPALSFKRSRPPPPPSLCQFSVFYLPYSICFNDNGPPLLHILDTVLCDAFFGVDMLISAFSWVIIDENASSYDSLRVDTSLLRFAKNDFRSVLANHAGIISKRILDYSGALSPHFEDQVVRSETAFHIAECTHSTQALRAHSAHIAPRLAPPLC